MNGIAISQNAANIGLAGQPNTGKSTLFNKLTKSKQHVGNWPGKTIEKKEGLFSYNNRNYNIVDLPGTYSLTANSAEEIISRDYIVSNDIDTLIVMVDASQLNRSMYLLSEIVGMSIPTIVILNMIDIAEQKGKHINISQLEKSLGVPIISMIAAKGKGVADLYEAIDEIEYQNTLLKTESFFNHYEEMFGEDFTHLVELLKKENFGKYSPEWVSVKLLENDVNIVNLVMHAVKDQYLSEISIILERNKDGMSKSAQCKHLWIGSNLKNAVNEKDTMNNFKRGTFDKLSTHKYLGMPLGILMILLGIVASFIVAMPLMGIITGMVLPIVSFGLENLLVQWGIFPWLTSLLTEALVPGAFMALFMTIFVGAFSLVLGFMEDIGYMARIAYMFDRAMSRVGLHGKAIMPFISCFGCTLAGISGSRVIDSWQKRLLTITSCMVIPCAAMWGVIGLLTSLFFGANAVWVIISLFIVSILHIKMTTWFFSKR
ncbi:MAG: ferrous iron transport protein B, partial [Clostridia bacterium]|nr:ferrous iron transport protein B [Clostridia bacterium]